MPSRQDGSGTDASIDWNVTVPEAPKVFTIRIVLGAAGAGVVSIEPAERQGANIELPFQ